MVSQSYTLQSNCPDISTTHWTPYIVIIILLTVFPMLYYTSLWLSCNHLVLLNPFTFFHPYPQTPSHLATVKIFSVSMILFLLCLFPYFVFYIQLLIHMYLLAVLYSLTFIYDFYSKKQEVPSILDLSILPWNSDFLLFILWDYLIRHIQVKIILFSFWWF